MRCKRKRYLTSFNAQGWTPIWPSTALHLGTLIHRVGAVWLADPNLQTPLEQVFLDEATKDLLILQRIHLDVGQRIDALKNNDYWEMVALGAAMCKNYQAFYKKPLPNGFKLVQPEQTVAIPIPNTEHCECKPATTMMGTCEKDCEDCQGSRPFHAFDSCYLYSQDGVHGYPCTCLQPHYLEGTLDAIILDPSDRLFVFERKTYGQRPNVRHLQRNWQFLSYTWLLQQTQTNLPSSITSITSSKLGGIAYDGWWKRSEPPKGKSMSDLFFRYFMVRNEDELEEFETDLSITVNEMASASVDPDKVPPRTIPALMGCIDCLDLIDFCDAISLNETPPMSKYVKREMTPIFDEFLHRTVGAGTND